jgi:hypothetical protein
VTLAITTHFAKKSDHKGMVRHAASQAGQAKMDPVLFRPIRLEGFGNDLFGNFEGMGENEF